MQLLTGEDALPEFCRKRVLVLGCGNVLFGDDGFGPAVAEGLQANWRMPDDVYVLDAGTGVRTVLFTLALTARRPEQVIVVDAVDLGRPAGELLTLSVDELPALKIDDFSLHQLPTSNLLAELRDLCGVNVVVVSCQVTSIPESVCPGLSDAVERAVPRACEMIAAKVGGHNGEQRAGRYV